MPDWNSPDSMHVWRTGLYVASVAFLLLSLGAGVLSELVFGRIERQLDNNQQEKLEGDLETEKRKVAALEEQQGPRRLTRAQVDYLVEILSPHAGSTVAIMNFHNDVESTNYANQFIALFEKAGWEVERSMPILGSIAMFPGVAVGVHSIDNMPASHEAFTMHLIS